MLENMEERVELCRQGKADINEFLLDNKGLILNILTKKFQRVPAPVMSRLGLSFDDLFQLGQIGVWKAYESFDSSKGFRWTTLAASCIINEVRLEIRNLQRRKRYKKDLEYLESVLQVADFKYNEPLMLKDILPDGSATTEEEWVWRVDVEIKLPRLMEVITNREKQILTMFLEDPEATQKEIAEKLGCSDANIRNIMRKISAKGMKVMEEAV